MRQLMKDRVWKWRQKGILLLLSAIFLYTGLWAQAGSMAELKPVFDRLKSIGTYSYENHTSMVFPTGEKDQATTQVYMDRAKKRLSYKSKNEIVMVNRGWVFKADHVNKTVGVFNIRSHDRKYKGSLPEIESIFKYSMASMFMDSTIARYGRILSKVQAGTLVTYKIGFAEGSQLKGMTIVYNTATLMPETISLRTEAKVDNKGRKMVTETVCDHYSLNVPEAVFDEHQYFSIQGGKPVLVQNKNYKVYSVL